MGSQMDPHYVIRYALKFHEIPEYESAVNGYELTMQYIQALRTLELKRLYELTVGLHTAVKALACFMTPAMKWRQVSLRRWSPFSSKNALLPSSSNKDKLKCIPLPAIPNTGFGINVACNPCLRAMVFTTNLNVWMLSQAATASEYFQSISC